MQTRTRRETVKFRRRATIAGLERELPPGEYEVSIDEALNEGLSVASYRRVATFITIPAVSRGAFEMVSVEKSSLDDAMSRDAELEGGIAAHSHE